MPGPEVNRVVGPDATTLIEHLAFALTVDDHDSMLTDASLLVEGSRIADIGEGDHWSKDALTRNWNERIDKLRESGRCGPVVPTCAFPQNVYMRDLRPEVAAFVRSEWSADWLPYYLEGCRAAPPSVAPFG